MNAKVEMACPDACQNLMVLAIGPRLVGRAVSLKYEAWFRH
jgi:hypothetical protein